MAQANLYDCLIRLFGQSYTIVCWCLFFLIQFAIGSLMDDFLGEFLCSKFEDVNEKWLYLFLILLILWYHIRPCIQTRHAKKFFHRTSCGYRLKSFSFWYITRRPIRHCDSLLFSIFRCCWWINLDGGVHCTGLWYTEYNTFRFGFVIIETNLINLHVCWILSFLLKSFNLFQIIYRRVNTLYLHCIIELVNNLSVNLPLFHSQLKICLWKKSDTDNLFPLVLFCFIFAYRCSP